LVVGLEVQLMPLVVQPTITTLLIVQPHLAVSKAAAVAPQEELVAAVAAVEVGQPLVVMEQQLQQLVRPPELEAQQEPMVPMPQQAERL
jgi:hypothetical protein